jgi:hypothetical protein
MSKVNDLDADLIQQLGEFLAVEGRAAKKA